MQNIEARLNEMTKKYNVFLLEKNVRHYVDTMLCNNTNRFVHTYHELGVTIHALTSENAALKQFVLENEG